MMRGEKLVIVPSFKDYRDTGEKSHHIIIPPRAATTFFGNKSVPNPINIRLMKQKYIDVGQEAAEALGDSKSQVNFFMISDPIVDRSFVFAAVDHPNGQKGFAKLARDEQAKADLKNESAGTSVAIQLGLPTIPVLNYYVESPGGLGVFETRFIDVALEGVTAQNSVEDRLKLKPKHGKYVVDVLMPLYLTPIPKHVDTSGLRMADWSIESPDIFFESNERFADVILDQQNHPLLDALIHDPDDKRNGSTVLRAIFDQAQATLHPIVDSAEAKEEDTFYFSANDVAPHNIVWPHRWGPNETFQTPVVFFDWEWAGKMSNAVLPLVFDIGNFYARTAPNQELQQAILDTAFHANPFQDEKQTYDVVKSAAILRTIFAAHFYMDPAQPRHDKSVAILETLYPNLKAFEQYKVS